MIERFNMISTRAKHHVYNNIIYQLMKGNRMKGAIQFSLYTRKGNTYLLYHFKFVGVNNIYFTRLSSR